jgi:uncharacterized sulfatase
MLVRFLSLLVLLLFATTSLRAAPPNVVLIVSDDHGFADYGFMGHPQIRTPHLDRLAARSLLFTQAHVAAPLCCPSLASIITGLHPHQHGITCNDPPVPQNLDPNKPQGNRARQPSFLAGRAVMTERIARCTTIPRLLSDYLSLQTGKWWQGNHTSAGFTHGMTHGDESRGGRHGDEGLHIGRQTMQPIADFLDRAQSAQQPFFIWYAPMLPHQPHDAPQRFVDLYRDVAPSPQVARYWANITWFDETCGQLFDLLAQRQLAENTLILYVADNGWIQDPAADRVAPRSKRTPYEGGLRTPILASWPGHIEPRRDEHYVSSIDLLPTIAAACQRAIPPDCQGVNLLDPQQVADRHAIFGAAYTHNALDLDRPARNLQYRYVIADGWKLIAPDPRNQPRESPQLYHLADDPLETHDQAAVDHARLQALTAQLNAWWPAQDQ